MQFTKMHGIGNDYVYVNGFAERVEDPAALAVKISDRHFGVGSDGLILILPSSKADVRMRMFNSDGSESEMCGNGVRCVAKYAFDHGLTAANPMRVETGRGVLTLSLQVVEGKVRQVTVDMGEPILALPEIPVDPKAVKPAGKNVWTLDLPGNPVQATFVSMGNPHAVIFVPEIKTVDLTRLGPLVERHPAFPRRINAHWVQIDRADHVTMVTWERGSGPTLACGTGACAVAVAGVLVGRTAREITATLPGGDLRLAWREADNHVHMTGPAAEVFTGAWPR